MTPLQTQMIVKIATSEFTTINGGVPDTLSDIGWVWGDTIIEDAQDKGTFTSMMNAGLVIQDGKGRESCVALTQFGFDTYKNIKK